MQQELGYPYVTGAMDAARAGLDRVRRMLGKLHRMELTFEEHAAIVEAIRAGNSEGAADAMRRHLDNVDVLLASFASDNPDLFSR